MRTSIYIDGFNFYYRSLKDTEFKWLDPKALCRNILGNGYEIEKIKYFTARVNATPDDPSKSQRQDVYLRALTAFIPEIEIHYGHFLTNKKMVRLAQPLGGRNWAEIKHTEEKGSDVNLAVHLLNDAWLDHYECAAIISNDSDLAEALRLVKLHKPSKKIIVMTPGDTHTTAKLLQNADQCRKIRKGALRVSQLPETIDGTGIYKPPSW